MFNGWYFNVTDHFVAYSYLCILLYLLSVLSVVGSIVFSRQIVLLTIIWYFNNDSIFGSINKAFTYLYVGYMHNPLIGVE